MIILKEALFLSSEYLNLKTLILTFKPNLFVIFCQIISDRCKLSNNQSFFFGVITLATGVLVKWLKADKDKFELV